MSHPLQGLSQARLARWFWVLFTAALLFFAIFRTMETDVRTPPLNAGVVEFELARTAEQAQAVVQSWPAGARLLIAFGLGLDYLFMPVYATLLAVGSLWAGKVLGQRRLPGAGLAPFLAWAMWGAAVFDAVENLALLAMLRDGGESLMPLEAGTAFVCAVIKFGLILVGVVYILYGRIGASLKAPVVGKARPAQGKGKRAARA
jgi:hypothetical protein